MIFSKNPATKKAITAFLALTLVFALAACGSKPAPTATPSPASAPETEQPVVTDPPVEEETMFTPGTYTASAVGVYGSDVIAAVTVDGEAILSIDVEQNETHGLGDDAIYMMIDSIVEYQTLNVDAVTGATASSMALLRAVYDALDQSGADMSVLENAAKPPLETYSNTETDVVIVGGGGAGIIAAIELTKAGKNVILLEKQGILGGNTLLASASFKSAETVSQKNAGIEGASIADFVDHLMGFKGTDADAAQLVAENSPFLVDMMVEAGANLSRVTNVFSMSPSDGSAPGIEIISSLKSIMADLGVEYRLNNPATKILMEDGKAVGVEVMAPGGAYEIRANAVMLTSGGYSASKDLIQEYHPDWIELGTTNCPGNTGDGQMMAQDVGAALSYMDGISINPTTYNTGASLLSFTPFRNAGSIIVNKQGERFAQETNMLYTETTNAILSQEDQLAYLVFDQSTIDNYGVIKGYYDLGFFVEGDTVEALAAEMGVDADGLVATIDRYKGFVANEKDEDFNRASMFCTFETPKFFAVKIEPAIHGTYGGVVLNLRGQVLTEAGETIPGLYASGCVADSKMSSNNATAYVPMAYARATAAAIVEDMAA